MRKTSGQAGPGIPLKAQMVDAPWAVTYDELLVIKSENRPDCDATGAFR